MPGSQDNSQSFPPVFPQFTTKTMPSRSSRDRSRSSGGGAWPISLTRPWSSALSRKWAPFHSKNHWILRHAPFRSRYFDGDMLTIINLYNQLRFGHGCSICPRFSRYSRCISQNVRTKWWSIPLWYCIAPPFWEQTVRKSIQIMVIHCIIQHAIPIPSHFLKFSLSSSNIASWTIPHWWFALGKNST